MCVCVEGVEVSGWWGLGGGEWSGVSGGVEWVGFG